MFNIEVKGTGSFVPTKVITNEDLSKIVETNDEWIVQRTGIKERRVAEDINTSYIAEMASREALNKAGIKPEDLELIIVATITPDNFCPSVACMIQDKLGAKKAACFDISAACSGFMFALSTACQFIKTGKFKNALIIGAEVLSKVIDWKDRGTCILFGDGAGAAVLERGKEGIIDTIIGTDGTLGEAIKVEAVAPIKEFSQCTNEVISGSSHSVVKMEGKEVFKFATSIMVETIKQLLDIAKCNLEDIKYIVPHQANIRIIEYAARKLNLSMDKFYMNIEKYANTSAASIPIALDELNRKGLIEKGDKIILVGFGGGLSWGGSIINWTQDRLTNN